VALVGAAGDQPAGDQEARDDEEDVDADVAAGDEGEPRVAEQDRDDRDGAQALDIRPKAALGGDKTSFSLGGRWRRGRANRRRD